MITVIPCKIGSVRVPLKNVRDVGGYPLVLWSVAAARLLGYKTYVMTDSEDIDKLMMDKGVEVIKCEQKGDKFLIDTLLHSDLEVMNEPIAYLRPTTPFRDITTLKRAISCFDMYKLYSLRSAHTLDDPLEKMYHWAQGYKPFTKSHDDANRPSEKMTPTYHPNGYIDITKTEKLSEGLFQEPFHMQCTPRTIEIDTEEDLFAAKEYVKHNGHPLLDYMKVIF